jgi:hypothetical protein
MTVYTVTTKDGNYLAFEKANRRGLSTIQFLPTPSSVAMRGTLTNALRAHVRKEKARA